MSETFTHKCGSSWTGKNRSHCSACHVTFGGVASFDRHRQSIGCVAPEDLGLVDNGNGVWVSRYGVDGD